MIGLHFGELAQFLVAFRAPLIPRNPDNDAFFVGEFTLAIKQLHVWKGQKEVPSQDVDASAKAI